MDPRNTNDVKKTSILDPYKSYIKARMEEGYLNAVVLFDEIKAQGYPGQIRLLRSFMEPLRPVVSTKATLRYETASGKQACLIGKTLCMSCYYLIKQTLFNR
ncbi:hypothetical protein LOK74_01905 [Brevibacillus humidisoli]|uniref:hypothetical protein n=1 Tax=Brevibacillus humidisoli TaxID=2895522 RepID=UPI001E622EEE|nr:hypothetical protein [Brevibacillus humidisoli]UFJ41315.1 hypothetical protein LOK74_01905 [Brevibacillus humidisoli]